MQKESKMAGIKGRKNKIKNRNKYLTKDSAKRQQERNEIKEDILHLGHSLRYVKTMAFSINA